MAKYRPHKVKVRHHVLAAIRPALERLADYPEVSAVTPGSIRPKRGGSLGLSLQYVTASGLRLLARSGGAVQEVYVVTAAPEQVIARLRQEGLLPAEEQ